MNSYSAFETERLILRPTTSEDASFVFELLNTPQWLQYIGDRNVRSVHDADEYIKNRMLPQLERLGYSNYTVIRKSDSVKVGTCGLYDREGLDAIDIGFAFLPQFANQGYAFEAANKLKEAALENFGISQICAITTPENTASRKLLKKLGMQYTKMVTIPNDEAKLMLFQLDLKKA